MKLVKKIYKELNWYFNGRIMDELKRMFMPVLFIASVAIFMKISSVMFQFNIDNELIFYLTVLSIAMASIMIIGLVVLWYTEVRPKVNKILKEVHIEVKWESLLDKFNRTY
ncbi:gp523 [Bacillus phage G]|uniref:Gp523 n=1 Tax=Bacillus phage G TaxID=2884420 RepID=G3MAR4_9CAUD|nr:gp523 [Bacillus phage G]AEO93781.1 gp523 [Bacillus phage G]